MAGFDRVCITTQNGILGAICNDHDGTVSGQFYTAPEDLTELAQLMGYKEEESEYGTIADDLDQDLANEYLEAQQLTQFMDKLVPIKDTITTYSVNESITKYDLLTTDKEGNEVLLSNTSYNKACNWLSNELKKNNFKIVDTETLDTDKTIIKTNSKTNYVYNEKEGSLKKLKESEESIKFIC